MLARRSTVISLLAAAVSIVVWAAAYPAIRVGLRSFSPGQLAALRFFIATAVFAVYLAILRPRLPRGMDLLRISIAGALGITAYNLLLNTGELTISASVASFLINCMPVFAALLAASFLGERLRPIGWVGTAISFSGVAIIAMVGGEGQGKHYGLDALLIVGAALCAAIMGILQKPLLRDYGAPAVTACLMASGALLLTPFLPGALRVAAQPAARTALLATVFLGVGPAALGYLAWGVVLRHFTLSQTASMLYVIPLVALGISYVWIREVPAPAALAGGVMAVAGVVVLNRYGRPAAAPPVASHPPLASPAGATAERGTQY